MANSASGESVVERVVRVLETFDSSRSVQTPSEIARRAGLPSSTAHRLVGELIAHGLLERDEDGATRVGIRLWELTTRGSYVLELRGRALPHMERVQSTIRQHTQLAVLEQDEVLCLERLSAPEPVSNITRVAGRLPAHASSSGLVMLAHARFDVVDRVLAAPLARLAPETITDPSRLRKKLSEVRRLGYAVAAGSIEAVSTGVAVPVREHGRVVAALGIVVPRDGPLERSIAVLLRAAADISQDLDRARFASR